MLPISAVRFRIRWSRRPNDDQTEASTISSMISSALSTSVEYESLKEFMQALNCAFGLQSLATATHADFLA
jgi:hypothetical protein